MLGLPPRILVTQPDAKRRNGFAASKTSVDKPAKSHFCNTATDRTPNQQNLAEKISFVAEIVSEVHETVEVSVISFLFQ